jgi:sigma-B regulation protein RsbU (phosphoserine phosphatase)
MNINPKKDTPRTREELANLFFARLMELLPDHVFFKDTEGRFQWITSAQAKFFGLSSPEEAIGKTDYDLFDPALARQRDADEREIIRSGVGFFGKLENNATNGKARWALTTKLPLVAEDGRIIGTFGISRNITEMKQAQDELEAQHRLLQTLIEILPCRIVVKDCEGRIQLTNEAYRQALGTSYSADGSQGLKLDELISDPRIENITDDDRTIIETGRPILNREEVDASLIGEKRWALLSKVPLLAADGKVQGIVGMSADITIQKDAEARAVRAQRELEVKNREIESELLLAREMQTELMAASLQSIRDTLDFSAPFAPQIDFVYEPCAHLAGDFFQAVPLSRTKMGLLLCDVMGHGVKAALVTTLMRGLLAEMTARELKPAQVLAALNDRLCSLLDRPTFPRFVTALYTTIDIIEGHLTVANAGHPWPLIMASDGKVKTIGSEGCCPALGLIPNVQYFSADISLKKSDRMMLFTDGLKEEHNWAGEEFGQERIAAILSRTADQPPEEALHQILHEVRSFSGSTMSADDLCAVMTSF